MIKVVLAGACGKMAGRIAQLAAQDSELELVGAFEAKDHPLIGKHLGTLLGVEPLDVRIASDIEEVIEKGNVLVDFTHPGATPVHVKSCLKHRRSMVIGTTGLSEKVLKEIHEASEKIAIVRSPNMSAGVNLLFRLVQLVSKTLNQGYDVEIVESHHRHKKDAPSGTALELARRIAEGRGVSLDKVAAYGRKGMTGERDPSAIGIHAVRGGDVVGEHRVSFLGEGETVELTHKASSRDAFAKGALLAIKFVARKKSGLYSMEDVLGL